MKAIFKDNAEAEMIDKTAELTIAYYKKLNDRFSDGRKHATGATVCAADFRLLFHNTAIINNDSAKNPTLSQKLREAYANMPHLKRVIDNGMALPGVAAKSAEFKTFL